MYIEPGGAQLPKARQAWKMIREDYLKGEKIGMLDKCRVGCSMPNIDC